MTIKLLRQYLGFTPGTVISTFGQGVCESLIQRGVAKIANPESIVTKQQRKAKTK